MLPARPQNPSPRLDKGPGPSCPDGESSSGSDFFPLSRGRCRLVRPCRPSGWVPGPGTSASKGGRGPRSHIGS